MLSLSCLCGAVDVAIPAPPAFVHACNCTLCRKSGAHWAYFDPSQVRVAGATAGYTRHDKESPAADLRFCISCGATTHFVLTDAAAARFGNTMMGVNMLLADEADLAGVERRFPDGRGWDGSGAFAYVRAPEVIGG